nr:hypothetical protein Iba_chr03fCG2230 [Ipomoea batatas]
MKTIASTVDDNAIFIAGELIWQPSSSGTFTSVELSMRYGNLALLCRPYGCQSQSCPLAIAVATAIISQESSEAASDDFTTSQKAKLHNPLDFPAISNGDDGATNNDGEFEDGILCCKMSPALVAIPQALSGKLYVDGGGRWHCEEENRRRRGWAPGDVRLPFHLQAMDVANQRLPQECPYISFGGGGCDFRLEVQGTRKSSETDRDLLDIFHPRVRSSAQEIAGGVGFCDATATVDRFRDNLSMKI